MRYVRFMLQDRLIALPERSRRLLAVVGAIFAIAVVGFHMYRAATYYMMDVEVFQDAGWALRRGQDLYSEDFPTRSGYRFIYPPFAALLFYPMTWAGPVTLQIIWTAATIAAVWAMLWMVSKRLRLPAPALVAALLLGPALLMDPLSENINFGQINVFLAVLVVADVLGFLPKKLRGLGIGVAAGIKITPAAYALIFLVRKDYRAVLTSFLWFLVTVAIGFALRFQESIYFWTDEFFEGNRGGAPTYEANQALSGLLARATLEDPALNIIVMACFVLGAILAGVAAFRFEQRGLRVASLAVVALAVCFVGPYTVSHHWSITMIFLPLIFTLRRPWQILLAIGFYVAHFLAPYDTFPGNPWGFALNPAEWVWGNLQGIFGGLAFVALIVCALRSADPEDALVGLDDGPVAKQTDRQPNV